MVVAVTRMKQVLQIDPVNRTALVDPGVTNISVDMAANKHGLRFAPDPASQKSCTVGGNIAENAGGPHCLAYGVTTNHTLGMEVVLEDGTVTWLSDTLGYDLRGVFVGSEGTFGIVTKILFRLLPTPEAANTMLAIYPKLEQACQAVAAIIARGIVPATLELMDSMMIKAVETARKLGYPADAGAILLVELEGLKEEVAEVSGPVQEILKETGAREVQFAQEAQDRERLWVGRKGALGALGALAPNYMLVDGTVPRSRLPRTVERVQEIARKFDLPVATLAHAGDGNLHPCILFDERVPDILKKVAALAGEILTACVEEGGTLSGEHGIGVEKNPYMPQIFSDRDMEVMKSVRRAFSPNELFNPGNVFPEGATVG
jgi:glycolate oxidase